MPVMKPVENSSQVAAMGYDESSRVLAVQFHNSTFQYRYQGVEPDIAAKVEGADSIGRALNEHIKQGGYEFEKIDLSGSDSEGGLV